MPYGIPGPSQISGSQEEPVIISSDEDVRIKVEKSDTTVTSENISGNDTADKKGTKRKKSAGKKGTRREKSADKKDSKRKKPVSRKTKGKAPVQSSSSSSSSSTDSSGSESENSSNLPLYLKRDDMPKELDEALRVNKEYPN